MNLKCVSTIGDLYWKSKKTLIAQLGGVNREAHSQLANKAGKITVFLNGKLKPGKNDRLYCLLEWQAAI